jgi:uncharacterized membrane protein YeaQ/YmgE (transglycosylase-associated protein family)
LLLGLALGLVALLRVTDDGVFATIVVVVFGAVWAHCLYTDRRSRPRKKQKRTVDGSG